MKRKTEQTTELVYVQAQDRTPLMPTRRCGKVRRLLKQKRAKVVNLNPFTIRLLYESKKFVQEVSVGVDLGSKHVGISATTGTEEILACQIENRTDVSRKFSARSQNRRSAVASHWIGKSRLQRYDFVRYGNIKAFISGSTNGRPILRHIDWSPATVKPSVSAKSVTFLYRKNGSFIIQKMNKKELLKSNKLL